MPKISIIIPVYNCEKYIALSIDSIISQPVFEQCEIIVVNDGSVDGTNDVCEGYIQTYSNIHLIWQENKGVSAARNVGIQNATGEFIMFLDADDRYTKGILNEQLLEELEKDYDVILFSAYNANIKRKRFGIDMRFKNAEVIGGRAISIPGTFASAVYRKNLLLEKQVWFDEGVRLNEDQIFSLKALYVANKIKSSSQFCYIYNKMPRSTTTALEKEFDRVIAWQKVHQWFDKYADKNREQMLRFCELKISARMLLYAKHFVQSRHGKKALLQELERVGGLEMLQNATKQNVLSYQYEDLELFQNNLDKFILVSKLEGYKLFFGRLALRIPVIRAWRDKRIYPYTKADKNGPEA